MEQENDETAMAMADEHYSSDAQPTQPKAEEAKRPRRHANVYDAVAGRITYETTLSSAVSKDKTPARSKPPRLTRHSVRTATLAPEEVLFRRKAAPERFAEFDVYMAHERNLPDGGQGSLPDADLLKGLHYYASHFYSTLGGHQRSALYQVGNRKIDERSMDDSALLAFGILLEEAGRDVLGNKGDMVFTEGLEVPVDIDTAPETRSAPTLPSEALTGNSVRPQTSVGFTDLGSWKRATKRRKMTDPEDV